MTTAYLNLALRGGALARLATLRGIAAYSNAPDVNLPPSRRFADWRAAREETFCTMSAPLSQGYNVEHAGTRYEKRTPIWSTFDGEQFRHEMKIHEIPRAGVRHNGWYSDADCSATMCGIVARLTHGRWIAGYYSSENGERVYLARVFDEMDDAVRAADDEAQRVAEEERGYSTRYREAQNIAYEIEGRETDVKELMPMRHHARARRELHAAIDKLRTLRDQLANEYSDIEV